MLGLGLTGLQAQESVNATGLTPHFPDTFFKA